MRNLYLLLIISSTILFSACQHVSNEPRLQEDSPQTIPQSANMISMQNMAYSVQNLEVKVGETVTWVNEDQVAHTVTSDAGEFNSGTIASGETYTFTFDEAGVYSYNCDFHPGMTGQITVTQ